MNGNRYTILVVDDSPDDIMIIEEILKKDYQVKAVTSGEAALKIAHSDNPPDLILLDIMMPGMDGFEVCRNLKQEAIGATIPVIFLTAKGMTADEKLGFELGAVDYIKKPVDPEIVETRVRSHLEQKDQTLRISEIRFRRLFETSKDGIVLVDAGTGMIIDVNPSLAAILGVSQEYFMGKRIAEIESLKGIISPKMRHQEVHRHDSSKYRGHQIETLDGRSINVELVSNSYVVNHREVMQFSIRDITDLVLAEHERDKFSARLSHYLSTSPTVTYSFVLEDGIAKWQWVSENIQNLLGYSSEEALVPDWWFRNVNALDRAGILEGIVNLSKREISVKEYRFSKKDRTAVWLHDEMHLVRGIGHDYEIVGTLTDISARKLAEEEIHLKSVALESAANAVIITDREGTIKWANPAFEALTGYSRVEAIGRNPRDLVRSGRQDLRLYSDLWDTIIAGNVWRGELENRRKSGEYYAEEMTITPVSDASGSIVNFIAIKNDITERKKSRELLETALREKSELLREIHHRVNNNIQVMTSLLSISSQEIIDEDVRGKLEDITRRLQSMAIIHRQFYVSEDLSRIDFSVYLRQVFERLRIEFPEGSINAIVECDDGEALLGLEQAIPAGLIVSELLINAMKHAFSDGRQAGTIRIVQRILKGILEVEVRDDGVGLPSDLDPAQAQSLGMTLIRILTEQLNGVVEFRREAGTAAILRFPTGAGDARQAP